MRTLSLGEAISLEALSFGLDSNDTDYLGPGWAEPGDGLRWLSGTSSEIWLEHPPHAEDFRLELDLEATSHAQRFAVSVRGVVIGRSVLIGRQTLCYHLPGPVIARKAPVRITIDHEDALPYHVRDENRERRRAPVCCHALKLLAAPGSASDPDVQRGRGLTPEQAQRATGLAADALISVFESLGHNCEFGSLQRQCGAEPLSLFRFGAPPLHHLISCMRTRFEQFGHIENLEFRLDGSQRREYVVREKYAGVSFHTFMYENEIDETQLLPKQSARLRFLVRKLIEDLQDGQKILVWKCSHARATLDQILALHEAVGAYGRNPLLWVVTADPDHPSGTVERLRPNLLKGYVHRFSDPASVSPPDVQAWLELCVHAYALTHGGADPASIAPAPPGLHRGRRLVLRHKLTVQGLAHIQGRGDTSSGADGWIGAHSSARALEGFALLDNPAFPLDCLTFQAVLADGSLSEPATSGQFRGTRGKNQPLRGFRLAIGEPWSGAVHLLCEASFVDGTTLPAAPAGSTCVARSGAALEALRLTLSPT